MSNDLRSIATTVCISLPCALHVGRRDSRKQSMQDGHRNGVARRHSADATIFVGNYLIMLLPTVGCWRPNEGVRQISAGQANMEDNCCDASVSIKAVVVFAFVPCWVGLTPALCLPWATLREGIADFETLPGSGTFVVLQRIPYSDAGCRFKTLATSMKQVGVGHA